LLLFALVDNYCSFRQEADGLGLIGDRRFMLVDATARFITQREYPRMCLICVELSDSGIIVTAPGVPDALHIDSSARTGETLTASVWDDSVRCEAVSREADAFFSRFLQVDCRLVTTGEGYSRAISKKYAPGSGSTQVGFADGYQFLLIRCPPCLALSVPLAS
jgi:uncharacterized protein YcbX